MPLLPGIDYGISNPIIGPLNISNNQGTPAVLFSYPWSTAKNVVIEYSLVRGASTEVGRIMISTDGSTVSHSTDVTNGANSGVNFLVALSGPNIELQYISNNSGSSGNFWYTQRSLYK